ncbi:Rhomboid-related protein 3 [Acipenser ruthenus]|uniref:rhomboid protease n=1 Tax=Acipenser ruthenus TaxID=7906 RepID=A0A662YV55_ACIRT|nr:Rhomboid-related protein 3 [Acipenser ruthenus]
MCEQKDLVFEGFLKKRKDRMKLTWSTYWFRLQNTTLFFYTKKKLDASHLRGQYYIHTVQSVREVKADRQYLFEITMKNGKKKLLSAETEELRALWMKFLWKAMQLPGPGRIQSACTWHDIPDLMQKAAQSTQSSSDEDRLSSASCSSDTPEPLAPPGSSAATAEEDRLSTELEQLDVYDFPLSNKAVDDEDRSTANRMDTESIYDFPKSLLEHSTEESSSTKERFSSFALPAPLLASMDPRMRARPREAHASPSPAVAANAEGDAIEVLESTDVLPMAPEDFDPENSGYISTERFRSLLNTHGSELDPHKLAVLLALADSNADGRICYQDFVNLMSNKRSNSFRRAILQGSRQRKSAALLEEPGLGVSQRLVRHVAFETLPREMDRKWYYDSYTGCPPPWFIIAVTIVAVFVYYGLLLDRWVLQVSHPLYLRNPLVYHPQLRAQAWRYLSYIFMHAGIEHLSLNVLLQLLVGVPLEMVHGALRIGFLYISGVLAAVCASLVSHSAVLVPAGSLAVSVADMTAPVVGSSGGVYALVSAHLANIVMNWSGMKCHFKLLRMGAALLCMSAEFGRAVWLRFYPSVYPPCPNPSFVAHLGGVAVGVTLGVVVLRNYEQRLQEQSLWWIFILVYIVFVLFAVFWNIFAYSLLELRLPPLP